MNTNYNTANPAFTANLVVKGMKLDPEKLSAVGKNLAEHTKHYKNDNLIMKKEFIDGSTDESFYMIDFNNGKTSAGFVSEIDDFEKWFAQTPADDIAKAFARVFKYAKLKEIKLNVLHNIRKNYTDTMAVGELNKAKFENTKNPVYKILATNSDNRAKELDTTFKKSSQYYQSLSDKVTDSPINNFVNWWEEL